MLEIIITFVLTSIWWIAIGRVCDRRNRRENICKALNVPYTFSDIRDDYNNEDDPWRKKGEKLKMVIAESDECHNAFWRDEIPGNCLHVIGNWDEYTWELYDFIQACNLFGFNIAIINKVTGETKAIV